MWCGAARRAASEARPFSHHSRKRSITLIACLRSASRSCSGTGFADDSSTLKPMSTREPPVCVFASPFTFFPLLSSIVGSGIAGSVGADAAFSSERSRASASRPGRIDLGGSRPGTKTDLTVDERWASILSLGRAYDTAPVSRFRQSQLESVGSTARAACAQCTRSVDDASHHE